MNGFRVFGFCTLYVKLAFLTLSLSLRWWYESQCLVHKLSIWLDGQLPVWLAGWVFVFLPNDWDLVGCEEFMSWQDAERETERVRQGDWDRERAQTKKWRECVWKIEQRRGGTLGVLLGCSQRKLSGGLFSPSFWKRGSMANHTHCCKTTLRKKRGRKEKNKEERRRLREEKKTQHRRNTVSHLIVDIKHSLLDLLIDLLGCVDESLP